MGDLTLRQQWAHDHIVRCPSCGGWEIVDHAELLRRADERGQVVTMCDHLRAGLLASETRAAS